MLPTNINSHLTDNPDVVILTAAYDDTSSFSKGAALGPAKVMECFDTQVEIFDRVHQKPTSSLIKIAHEDAGVLNGKDPQEVITKIETLYEKVLNAKSFPILIGGEHSVSIGAFRALSKKLKPQDVTIVQIDAHFDLRNDDSDYHEHPTPFAHSAVMRRAHEMGFNLLQVGVRAYSEEEYIYAKNNSGTITVFEWGPHIPPIDQIIGSIKTPLVYLSIDTDGIDPAHLPGTGTPVQGGLEWYYLFELLDELFKNYKVIAADMVEIAPQKDSVVTEFGAAQIVYTMCGYIGPRARS